jgi:L-Ala-D/L-Glu epimerase
MHVSVHQRTLPLRAPFRTAGWTILEREVLILRIDDPISGLSGYGEAAPLRAFGTESFDEAAETLHQFAREYNGSDLNALSFSEVTGHLVCDVLQDTPTASYAVETASFDLLARIAEVPLAKLLGADPIPTSIPVNAVVSGGDMEETLRTAAAALQSGFTCLKLKVGGGQNALDIERVDAVRKLAGSDVIIRLDANGAWDLPTAQHMLEQLAPFSIEYIEQPVADILELAELRRAGIIPIAADESAQRFSDARRLIRDEAADILIIKPMAVGGSARAIYLADDAFGAGMDVVFTSFIDSAIGRNTVAQLCAAMSHFTRHHGLATGSLFATDFATDTISEGCFLFPQQAGIGIIPELGDERAST